MTKRYIQLVPSEGGREEEEAEFPHLSTTSESWKGREIHVAGRSLIVGRAVSYGAECMVCTATSTDTLQGGDQLAVKILYPHLGAFPTVRARFIEEARLGMLAGGAGFPRVHGYGVTHGTLAFVMDRIVGSTLDELMEGLFRRTLRLPAEVAISMVGAAVESVSMLHRLRGQGFDLGGVVHRDICPENLMVDDEGRVWLLDLGAVGRLREGRVPPMEELLGSYGYMSPEQANGLEVEPRSDLYALAVILWELLTGGRYNPGGSTFGECDWAAHAELLECGVPHLSGALKEAVESALEPVMDLRPVGLDVWRDSLFQACPEAHACGAQERLRWMRALRVKKPVGPLEPFAVDPELIPTPAPPTRSSGGIG